MKKIISLVLFLILALSLAACGDTETEANTESSAEVETTESAQETEAETAEDTAANSEIPGIPEESIYAGVWGQNAIVNAFELVGESYMCVDLEKGTDPDGREAWVVNLREIDNEEAPVYKCFVSDTFCYLEDGAPLSVED